MSGPLLRERWYSPVELADLTGVSVDTLERWRSQGKRTCVHQKSLRDGWPTPNPTSSYGYNHYARKKETRSRMLRKRRGHWHYRFQLQGREFSGNTGLEATAREIAKPPR